MIYNLSGFAEVRIFPLFLVMTSLWRHCDVIGPIFENFFFYSGRPQDLIYSMGVGNTLNCINSSLFKDFIFQQKPHSISIWWFRDFKWDAVILLFTSPSLDVDCIYLDSWTKFNFIELGAVTTMVVEKAPKSFTVPKNRWRLKVYFWEWYRHKLWQAFYTLR